MHASFVELINDSRTPDELKAKLVLLFLKIEKCKSIKEMKEMFTLMLEVLTDIEKVQEGLDAKTH